MRIGNNKEHKAVIAILDSLLVNKKQAITRKMINTKLSEKDKAKIESHLGDFLDDKNPIYIYIKSGEIYFQIRVHNETLYGFDNYEEAKSVYRRIQKGEVSIKDLKIQSQKTKKKTPASKITLEDGFNRLLERHMNEYNAGNVKYSSYTKKQSTIKYHILPYFKNVPLVKITESDIDRFVDQIKFHELSYRHKKGEEKKLSVAMQNEVFMYFKKLFKTTKRWFNVDVKLDIDDVLEEAIGSSALKKEKKKYKRKIDDVIENIYDDLNKVFKSIRTLENGIYNPIYGIELMIFSTGMRIDEVTALTPSDFDQENKTLSITKSITWHPNKDKTNKSYEITATKEWDDRTILLSDSLCMYLTNYIEKLKKLSFYSDDMYIFSRLEYGRTENNKLDPFSLKTFTNHIRSAYVHAGLIQEGESIPRNHVARHAFNTLIEKHREVADSDRKAYLGHSNGSGVNEGYTHKSREEEKKIAKIAEDFCGNLVDETL